MEITLGDAILFFIGVVTPFVCIAILLARHYHRKHRNREGIDEERRK